MCKSFIDSEFKKRFCGGGTFLSFSFWLKNSALNINLISNLMNWGQGIMSDSFILVIPIN